MGCGVLWHQVHQLDDALGAMRTAGIPELSDVYQKLYSFRGQLLGQIGYKFPRSVLQIIKLIGLSPGTISLWLDVESGWMVEARERPGAPPVYRSVTNNIAMTILKGELTHDLETELLTPDDYLGE